MPNMKVVGTGMYVPDRVVTNHDLAKLMDTNDEWIIQRTGIRERRYVPPGMTSADMIEQAALTAIKEAGIEKDEIEAVVSATLSMDHMFPGIAPFVQDRLGLNGCAVVDIRNQCTGFLYSLAIADAWIKTGLYKTILVTGSEIHSTGLDFSTRGRDVSVIFGDGAGVFVAQATDGQDGPGVLGTDLHGDGKYAKALWTEAEGSVFHPRLTHKMLDEKRLFPQMKGQLVFAHAIRKLPESMKTACEKAGLGIQDVDFWVFHQANLRINEFVCQGLDIPLDKTLNNIDVYGNTTAATMPIVTYEAKKKGLIKDGSIVGFAAFGAGFTWGTIIMRW
ncbi:MAG: beta-ketoacyl-ACP synthase III [Candidatus Lernaella stagnicola]|nr:beta-ketoacyl-ACP synthase III [Candidatus Lernaella stagnicola]